MISGAKHKSLGSTTSSSRTRPSCLAQLGDLPGLSVTTLEDLSTEQKEAVLIDVGQVCRKLTDDLGVKWKPQPVDSALRQQTIQWIKTEIEPAIGKSVDKRFLISTDAGLTYTERVYEGGDFETKASMVKYVSVAIYLDDMIDKDEGMAKRAESFLVGMLQRDNVGNTEIMQDVDVDSHATWLEVYRRVSVELASHMSDPLVSNMLLHSCTLFIEGCALEHYIQQDQAKYFLINDAETERTRDAAEKRLATEKGREIPLPLDNDRSSATPNDDFSADGRIGDDHLVPHGWPIWLRERSAVAETFAITSFCAAPGGVEVPTWLWVTAISELRTIILSTNDVLSFAKELLADDSTSSIAVLTKERRLIGMPGTAPDGGWCLRDTFDEVMSKILVAGARINRLLRPSNPEARYGDDGRVYSLDELAAIVKERPENAGNGESMKALALRLWETHQRGYVAWHFQCTRYRTFELFDWVRDMMGGKPVEGPEWLTKSFPEAMAGKR